MLRTVYMALPGATKRAGLTRTDMTAKRIPTKISKVNVGTAEIIPVAMAQHARCPNSMNESSGEASTTVHDRRVWLVLSTQGRSADHNPSLIVLMYIRL